LIRLPQDLYHLLFAEPALLHGFRPSSRKPSSQIPVGRRSPGRSRGPAMTLSDRILQISVVGAILGFVGWMLCIAANRIMNSPVSYRCVVATLDEEIPLESDEGGRFLSVARLDDGRRIQINGLRGQPFRGGQRVILETPVAQSGAVHGY